jgi:ATP-dependent helicase Lhr and Lhr-like helicase
VLRFPDTDEPPDPIGFLVESAEAMQLVLRQLGTTALFAGRFREAAGRALLLPRRRADARSPLWQLRKRSYDLLSVASRYPKFPLLLEAYRECLRDVFDMPALIETCAPDRTAPAARARGGDAQAFAVCRFAALQLCGQLPL